MGAARLSRLARCGVAMATRRQTPQCQSSLDLLRCTDGPMARPLAQLQVEEQHRGQRSSVFEKRQLRTAAKSSSDACGQVGYSYWAQAIKAERVAIKGSHLQGVLHAGMLGHFGGRQTTEREHRLRARLPELGRLPSVGWCGGGRWSRGTERRWAHHAERERCRGKRREVAAARRLQLVRRFAELDGGRRTALGAGSAKGVNRRVERRAPPRLAEGARARATRRRGRACHRRRRLDVL